MGKTIKQLADELGVSKTAIRKYMTADFREKYVQTDKKGLLYINKDGENQLQSLRKPPQTTANQFAETTENQVESLRKPPQTTANQFAETTENQVCDGTMELLQKTIAVLEKQLSEKDMQLAEKDKQIRLLQEQSSKLTIALDNTTNSLKASQALHAATVTQIADNQGQQSQTVSGESWFSKLFKH
jgi:predicted transcriptional regulator